MFTYFNFISVQFYLFLSIAATAQDTLVLNSGDEIYGKILEISENSISYKKKETINGPTYTTDLSKVFMAIYKGGGREIFKQQGLNRQEEHETTSSQSLKEAGLTFSMKEIKNIGKSTGEVRLTGTVDIFANSSLYASISFSCYQDITEEGDYNTPTQKYLVKNLIFMSVASSNLHDYLDARYEDVYGKGMGWALPPKFFTSTGSACSVALLQHHNTSDLPWGLAKPLSTKYSLVDCSTIEKKILSIVAVWFKVNFSKN